MQILRALAIARRRAKTVSRPAHFPGPKTRHRCRPLDAGVILRPVKKPLIIVESPKKAQTIKKFLPALRREGVGRARARFAEVHPGGRRRQFVRRRDT